VIERLRTRWPSRRHPRSALPSRYLDADLDAQGRTALETHLSRCPRCRTELASLASTIRALGMLEPERPQGLADSIIAALRAEPQREAAESKPSAAGGGSPALALVPAAAQASAGDHTRKRWPREARSALRWCLRRPQLRLTLPIALIAGVVLSLVNMGGMLMHRRIDLGGCVSCAIDFLVPFLALNLGMLMLLRVPRRGRL
jgi:anti-sigma factor RsiW